jgi:hypothetical protein
MDVPVREERDEINGRPPKSLVRSETVPKIGKVGVWGRVAWDGEGEVKKWEKEKQIG